jgi:hypothetical protein
MALPNLPAGITQRTGLQLIENGYSRLNDHVSNNYWTSNLKLTEADANTLGFYDAATGLVVKNIKARGIRFVDSYDNVRAASASYIDAGEDLSAALPITFTAISPDVPRTRDAFTIAYLGILGAT